MRYIVAAAAALLIASSALASSSVITGSASWGQPLTHAFVTESVGTVTVNVTYSSKRSQTAGLTVKHLLDPNDPYSYDLYCLASDRPTAVANPQPSGNFTCSFTDAPAGHWTAEFWPVSGGKVQATMTVEAP